MIHQLVYFFRYNVISMNKKFIHARLATGPYMNKPKDEIFIPRIKFMPEIVRLTKLTMDGAIFCRQNESGVLAPWRIGWTPGAPGLVNNCTTNLICFIASASWISLQSPAWLSFVLYFYSSDVVITCFHSAHSLV